MEAEPVEQSGKIKGNIWKAKLMSMKLKIKIKILKICTEAKMNLS